MVEIVFEILRNESWLHIENANCVQRLGFLLPKWSGGATTYVKISFHEKDNFSFNCFEIFQGIISFSSISSNC